MLAVLAREASDAEALAKRAHTVLETTTRAGLGNVASSAGESGVAKALAEAALTVARAVARALGQLNRAVGPAVTRVAEALAEMAHTQTIAIVGAAG